MKVVIYAKPQFKFTLNDEELNILLRCSECHYDSRCRQASQQPTKLHEHVARDHFLYGYKNMIDWEKKEGNSEISLLEDFRVLDTMAKIIENPPPDVNMDAARALMRSIKQAFIVNGKSFPLVEIHVP